MSTELLLGLLGLAVLDSFNPATMVTVTLILLAPGDRPVLKALAVVLGAFTTVAVVGAAIYLGAATAAEAVDSGLVWLRRLAFGAAALALLVAAVRRLRPRRRRPVVLPDWFTPLTAYPLGVLVTAADLPNAFPYFIAIERLVEADVPGWSGLALICGYAAIYCVPCLFLLTAGMVHADRVKVLLARVYDRFGSAATVSRSLPAALGLAACALVAGSLAATA